MKKLSFILLPALLMLSGLLYGQVDSDSTQLLDLEDLSVPPLDQDQVQPDDQDAQGQRPAREQQVKEPNLQIQPRPQTGRTNQEPAQTPPRQQTGRPNQNPVQSTQQQTVRPNQDPALTVPQRTGQNPAPQQRAQEPVQQQTTQQRAAQNPAPQPTTPQQVVQPEQRQPQQRQPQQGFPPAPQQSVQQQIQQSPMMEERPVTSAPTNVKMTTPLISIDLIMDLYNKDIDFDIDYSGSTGAGVSNLGKKRPSEQEVQKMVTEQMDTTAAIQEPKKSGKEKKGTKELPREDGAKPYTAEDANYNKAMISLNNAQQLFASRRYAEALAEINRSITFAPNIALSYSVKGSVHYMLRQVTEAKRSWERALELDPTMDNVRAILLRMY